jgi:hypothetical protein
MNMSQCDGGSNWTRAWGSAAAKAARHRRKCVLALSALGIAMAASACAKGPAVLTQQVDARRHGSDLEAAFLKANEAANRAVMADNDEASTAAAKEAASASERAAQSLAALEPLVRVLNYVEEGQHLAAFKKAFEEYRALDAAILPLAVENSNLKAQRLSFGPAQEASDAFASALAGIPSPRSAAVEANIGAARSAILEVQVIEARHIAEPDESTMNRMEQRMDALTVEAKSRIERVRTAIPAAGPQVTGAETALERFVAVNREIVALSRRNTNVRSLALSLGRKRVIAAECEDQLRALNDALARHQFQATR